MTAVIHEGLEGFIGSSALTDTAPPRPAWVGKVERIFTRTSKFVDPKTGAESESTELVWKVKPETFAVKSQDGTASVRWRISSRTSSLYGIAMKSVELATGRKQDTSDAMKANVGQHYLFVEIPPTHDALKVLGKFQANVKNNLTTVQAAPAGWQANVPADIEDQRLTAMAKWAEEEEARQAGQSSVEVEEVGSINSVQTGSDLIDFGDSLDVILDFYSNDGEGRSKGSLTKEAAQTPAIMALPTELRRAVVTDKAGKQLKAQGLLTMTGDTYQLAA